MKPMLALSFAIGIAVLLLPSPAAIADLPEGNCGGHPERRSIEAESSPCLHVRAEGLLVPADPTGTPLRMESYSIEADAEFFSCCVRNFRVHVRAEFVLSVQPSACAGPLRLAFPLTTHALYGDHNRFETVRISVDGAETPYTAAIDSSRFRLVAPEPGYAYEVWYMGRRINHAAHPLLIGADRLQTAAPWLLQAGYDLVLLFDANPVPDEPSHIVVDYISSSNDFSECCRGVSKPARSPDGYFFRFDLTSTKYWAGPKLCTVTLRDSPSAIWAAVPDSTMSTVAAPEEIVLQGYGDRVRELAVPVQPAVFGIWPRRWLWSGPGESDVLFESRWLAGESPHVDRAVLGRIAPTLGVEIRADLPMELDSLDPFDHFSGSVGALPISPPVFFDVYGTGYLGEDPNHHFDATIRVPVKGLAVTGHDLVVRDVSVIPPGSSGNPGPIGWKVQAHISNDGWFAERALVTVYLDRIYAGVFDIGFLPPHDVPREIRLPIDWIGTPPVEVRVEIEPAAGEVELANNTACVTYPAWDSLGCRK
jgi:hypothetical protein